MIAYLSAGPVMFSIIVIARWLWSGRWGEALWLLAVVLLATLVMMAVSLGGVYWRDADSMQLTQQYRWDGFYWMALPIFYLAAWALTVGTIIQWLCRTHVLRARQHSMS